MWVIQRRWINKWTDEEKKDRERRAMDGIDTISPSSLLLLFPLSLGFSAVLRQRALGLLDAGDELFGQARAVKRLLWIFSVALEHLGLQLCAQRPSLPRSDVSLSLRSCLVVLFSRLLVVVKVFFLQYLKLFFIEAGDARQFLLPSLQLFGQYLGLFLLFMGLSFLHDEGRGQLIQSRGCCGLSLSLSQLGQLLLHQGLLALKVFADFFLYFCIGGSCWFGT